MIKLIINQQKGFSLLTALFILIVLASLGVTMVTISSTQHQTNNYSLLNARAYQAARSGIEWGIYQVINNNNCSGFPKTIDFSQDGLTGFQTRIDCFPPPTSHTELDHSFNIYNLTAVSQSDTVSFGHFAYVSREISITVTDVAP